MNEILNFLKTIVNPEKELREFLEKNIIFYSKENEGENLFINEIYFVNDKGEFTEFFDKRIFVDIGYYPPKKE